MRLVDWFALNKRISLPLPFPLPLPAKRERELVEKLARVESRGTNDVWGRRRKERKRERRVIEDPKIVIISSAKRLDSPSGRRSFLEEEG